MGLANGVHHLAMCTGNLKAQTGFFTDVLGAIDPAKPHMVYPPDAYQKLMSTPDDIVTARISEPEPPVQAGASRQGP